MITATLKSDPRLSDEVVILEEAERKIRIAVKQGAFRFASDAEVRAEVKQIISLVTEKIKIEVLREAAKRSLWKFYLKQRDYASALSYGGLSVFLAASALVSGSTTESVMPKARAERIISEKVGREGTYNLGNAAQLYHKEYMEKLVKPMLSKMAKERPTLMSGKKRSTLIAKAELEVRHSERQKELSDLKTAGVRLVVISSHADCSPRCRPFQGRVFSLDGTYGVTDDGRKFEPLENATDIYTKNGKWKNGLFGFNCRHKALPYKSGLRYPTVSSSEERREYEITQKQRAYERQIRALKTEMDMTRGIDTGKYKIARARLKTLRKRYIEYSKANGRAYYPERIKSLFDGEGKVNSTVTFETNESVIIRSGVKNISERSEKTLVINLGGQLKAEAVKKELSEAFARGCDTAKAVFRKYTDDDTVETWDSPEGNYHEDGKIYLNARQSIEDPRGIPTICFHECGHIIDYKASPAGTRLSLSGTFGELIRSDIKSYIESIVDRNGFGAYLKLSEELGASMSRSKAARFHAISDIFEAVTKGRVVGKYGHMEKLPRYWQTAGALESEAFAHMFQSLFNPEDYALMKKYLPNALSEFEKMIERIAK